MCAMVGAGFVAGCLRQPVREDPMDRHQAVRDAIMSAILHLRAYAFTMSGSRDRADDLVQETLVRALAHIDSFEPGTRMMAWLITILRNAVLSEYRKRPGRLPNAA
jgi:RNA polymerase sigma-70 factor, ECF subfamily